MAADSLMLYATGWARGLNVYRSTHRQKTATVELGPDLIVSVRVPAAWSDEQVSALVAQRESWLAAQAAHFKRYEPRTPARSCVRGETHRHLGRQLMLRVVAATRDGETVEIQGHELVVAVRRAAEPSRVAGLLEAWRRREAREVFARRLEVCRAHHLLAAVPTPRLQLRTMNSRWGSMSGQAMLTLNPNLLQAPVSCIDCVIQHELCHLLVRAHSPQFFELLDRLNPRWRAQRAMLDALLA